MAFRVVLVVVSILQLANSVVCFEQVLATSVTVSEGPNKTMSLIERLNQNVEAIRTKIAQQNNATVSSINKHDKKMADSLHKSFLINNGDFIFNGNIPIADTPMQIDQTPDELQLNSSFIELFDELLQIKNNSLRALIQLRYFKPNLFKNKLNHLKTPANGNDDSFNKNLANHSPIRLNKTENEQIEPKVPSSPPPNKLNPMKFPNLIKAQNSLIKVTVKNNQPSWLLTNFGLHMQNWISNFNLKLNKILASIRSTNPIQGGQFIYNNGRLISQSRSEDSEDNEDFKVDQLDEDNRLRVKREIIEEERSASMRFNCTELDESRCKETELSIKSNLERSFPGTMAAIGENCRQISFLFSNCWPRQLNDLKQSLASWNESLIALNEFPIIGDSPAIGDRNGLDRKRACSQRLNEPQVPVPVLERINWMWLNLCMDKKFRQDYVDNMRCLSLWTQERARLVCNNEFIRMQSNLDRVPLDGITRIATAAPLPPHPPASMLKHETRGRILLKKRSTGIIINHHYQQENSNSPMASSMVTNKPVLDILDRELESKTLCCSFDIFLRCVHKQALRDCSRSGAQFVVNFMTRVGTEDLKYLCNDDPNNPNQRQTQKHLGSKRGNGFNELNPFLEINYCVDPRIHRALFGGSSNGDPTNPKRNFTTSNGLNMRLPPNRTNYKDSNNIESDPYLSDPTTDSENVAHSNSSTLAGVLAYCSLVFLCNTVFLPEYCFIRRLLNL